MDLLVFGSQFNSQSRKTLQEVIGGSSKGTGLRIITRR